MFLLLTVAQADGQHEGFMANHGQVRDQDLEPVPQVKYMLARPGLNVRLQGDGITYDTYRVEEHPAKDAEPLDESQGRTFRFHRIDLRFVNGDPHVGLEPGGTSEDHLNFYSEAIGEGGATDVHHCSTVTYTGPWPGVDLRCMMEDDRFKYEVIVHPGGRLSDVRFKVDGAVLSLDPDGALVFAWGEGRMREVLPMSWSEVNGRKTRADVRYRVHEDGSFGFVREDDRPGTLVIDPVPVVSWSTFYGGSLADNVAGVANDPAGNVYATGETLSANNIATTGAFDQFYSGYPGAMLVKFNANGIRQWATYFGNDGGKPCRAVTCSANSTSVAIAGYTKNPGLGTAGTFQPALAGTVDGFIARFSSSGALQWCTYYGGPAYDLIHDISLNESGVSTVVGSTSNATGMATTGDITFGGGTDAFVARFDDAGGRIWSTYIGGTQSDEALGVNVRTFLGSTSIIVSGTTSSPAGVATTGAWDTALGGSSDAFLARLSVSGQMQWCTYFGGPGAETGTSAAFLALDRIALVGRTTSTTGLGTSGVAQSAPGYIGGSVGDGYLASFSISGTRQWATYVGSYYTAVDDVVNDVVGTSDGTAIITGGAGGSLGTSGSWDPTWNGSQDAFVGAYSSSGAKLWSGYIGGDQTDQGAAVSLRTSGSDVSIIVGGFTFSETNVATNPSHQSSIGGSQDGFVTRLNWNTASGMVTMDDPATAGSGARFVVDLNTVHVEDLPQGASGPSTMQVFDMQGRHLGTARGANGVSFNGLGAGVYLFVVDDGAHRSAARVVVP
ncbi:MAG TPA: T9SS type A sorting domain-containing protein [Flavobacteriales bacterium]|nr:T9SS type A sorting domain-containing protein [Flavobacteriales bacterium]HMR26587.1 T9SS type A sorting domain-containing protein [Flavobacteriales bacterium]